MSSHPGNRTLAPSQGSPSLDLGEAATTKKQHASLACLSCKQKRRKCGGPPAPCAPCTLGRVECIFNATDDHRRTSFRKRKAQEAEQYKQTLVGMLEEIRQSKDTEVHELIALIKSDASVEETIKSIDKHLEELREAGLERANTSQQLEKARAEALRLSPQASESLRKVMRIQELVKPEPLFQVQAKPWTSLSDDDEFVSHLVSLYFTWWNPFWHPIDQDAFIEAMSTNRAEHPLCSPFLVNAILAMGSQYSDIPDDKSQSAYDINRGEKFHAEAKRLWEAEHGRSSLTNLQALHVLLCSANIRGRDTEGWTIMGHIIQMNNDLGLSWKIPKARVDDAELAKKIKDSYRLVAWAIYNLHVVFGMAFLKPIALSTPKLGLPFDGDAIQKKATWSPYPHVDPRSICPGLVTNALCDLFQLCAEISALLYPSDGPLDPITLRTRAAELEQRFKDWRFALHDSLQDPSDAPQAVIDVHFVYYAGLISLSEVLIKPSVTPPNTTQQQQYIRYREERSVGYVLEALPLYKNYYGNYGNNILGTYSIHNAVVSCYALMRSLTTDSSREMFSELYLWIVAAGRRHPIWKANALMLYETAREFDVELPTDLKDVTERLRKDYWQLSDSAELRTSYPNFAVAREAFDEDDFKLGELLEKWGSLRFNGDD